MTAEEFIPKNPNGMYSRNEIVQWAEKYAKIPKDIIVLCNNENGNHDVIFAGRTDGDVDNFFKSGDKEKVSDYNTKSYKIKLITYK